MSEEVEMDMSCSFSDSMRLSSVVGDTVVVVVAVSLVAMLGVGSREVTTLVEVTLRVTT